MIDVAIVGGAGYVGGELIRLILNHPKCNLKLVTSQSQSGKSIHEVHKDLIGWTDLSFTSTYNLPVDVIIIATGHGKSRSFLEKAVLPDEVIIIDMSRDYRLKDNADGFIYGLPELNKSEIQRSHKIANPGCFATCIQLALFPLAKSGYLKNDVHVTAVTGSTGAGQNPTSTTHFSWRNNNISIYKPFVHQHLDEIYQSVLQLQPSFEKDINFIPMRGGFARGIFSSIYLESSLEKDEITEIFEEYYASSPFVHLSHTPLTVKDVVNTNNALLYVDQFQNKIRIESVLDNLLKGAAGQAVQNMNLVCGFDEDTGLNLKGSIY